jgi:hypothetical protein
MKYVFKSSFIQHTFIQYLLHVSHQSSFWQKRKSKRGKASVFIGLVLWSEKTSIQLNTRELMISAMKGKL